MEIEIGELEAAEREEAALLMAAAFVTSPIHVAAFGSADAVSLRKNEAMFRVVVFKLSHELTVARAAGRLAAVAGRIDWPRCQPSLPEQLRVAPAMIWALGNTLPRVLQWFGEWGDHDPHASHSHLGPVAVRPDLQGRGLGSRLLEHCCAELDAAGKSSYLETDKPENVRLYRRLGYEVVREAEVFGVPNWFMWRSPRADRLRRA